MTVGRSKQHKDLIKFTVSDETSFFRSGFIKAKMFHLKHGFRKKKKNKEGLQGPQHKKDMGLFDRVQRRQ